MVGNQACIAIGINQYQFFQPLSYAQQDAQALQDFLVGEVGLPPERCLLLTDSSPPVAGHSTYPTRDAIEEWVGKFCQTLHPGGILWLFWSGYGATREGRDYLMPQEGDPEDIAATGISARSLLSALKSAQERANPPLKILLLLDINRASGSGSLGEIGTETAAIAKDLEIPTIISCRPDQFSRESGVLRHGLFAAALLECLRYSRCVTVDHLVRYLNQRLPQLSEHLWLPPQEPLVAVHPPEKIHQLIWQPKENGAVINRELLVALSNGAGGANGKAVYGFEYPGAAANNGTGGGGPKSRGGNLRNGQPVNGKNHTRSDKPAALSPEPMRADAPPNSPAPSSEILPSPPADSRKSRESKLSGRQQYLLVWSGAAAVVFMLGAIASRSIFAIDHSQETEPAPAEVVQSPPSPGVSLPPPASEATATARQQSSQLLLDKATLAILPTEASQFGHAIAIARQIPPDDPLYPQAQENIDRWGSVILDIAQARAKQGNFSGAIAAAGLVPKDRLVLAEQAKQLAARWQQEAAQQQANQSLLKAAAASARKKQPSSYAQAIAALRPIKPGQPKYAEAQQLAAQWSRAILDIAKTRAARRRFSSAIEAAGLVPPDAPVYADAQKAIAQWQGRLPR